MSNSTVHITNLPRNCTEDAVHDLFITFGPISQLLLKDDIRNRNHKYADIKYKDPSDSQQAILNMHGFEYFGEVLVARELGDEVFDSRSKNHNSQAAVWNQDHDQDNDQDQIDE